jgi:CRP/FNR family cyclic AMP-dependent transcriptional regulator
VEPGLLRQNSLFAGLPEADLALVARRSRMRTLAAGARLYTENEAAADIYLVDQGRLALLVEAGQGRQTMQGTVGRRGICGVAAMLSQAVHIETARCLERTTVIAIPAAVLNEMCQKDCHVCLRVMEAIATVVSTQLKDARFQLTHLLMPGEGPRPQEHTGASA